jgi:hypothetical protein
LVPCAPWLWRASVCRTDARKILSGWRSGRRRDRLNPLLDLGSPWSQGHFLGSTEGLASFARHSAALSGLPQAARTVIILKISPGKNHNHALLLVYGISGTCGNPGRVVPCDCSPGAARPGTPSPELRCDSPTTRQMPVSHRQSLETSSSSWSPRGLQCRR